MRTGASRYPPWHQRNRISKGESTETTYMRARGCQSPQPYQGSLHVSPKCRQCWSQLEAVESSVDSHRDMGQNPLRKCKAPLHGATHSALVKAWPPGACLLWLRTAGLQGSWLPPGAANCSVVKPTLPYRTECPSVELTGLL